jgi:hypothetical protein
MGFLGESSKVTEVFYLFKEFKIGKLGFMQINLVNGGERV